MTQEISKYDRFTQWLIYWFVPVGSNEEQTQHRLLEIGMCIGIFGSALVGMLYLIILAIL